jgi:polysaccharide export outer membrane protein
MKFISSLLLLTIPLYFISCKTQQKTPTYLQDLTVTDTSGKIATPPELVIQKGDVLSIQIVSLANKPEADAIYNMPAVGAIGSAGTGASATSGYLVDEHGDIVHHRLGRFHAEGLTKKQLAADIVKRLTDPVPLLTDPTVVIKITNFKVTMLGQVGQQGAIPIPSERVTLLEAIGMAGGVTDYGKKTGLKILREYNGKREVGIIDLASKNIFESPYYYLVQNDVIIVEDSNRRLKDEEQTRLMQKISFAFTLVTVAATITNLFIKN